MAEAAQRLGYRRNDVDLNLPQLEKVFEVGARFTKEPYRDKVVDWTVQSGAFTPPTEQTAQVLNVCGIGVIGDESVDNAKELARVIAWMGSPGEVRREPVGETTTFVFREARSGRVLLEDVDPAARQAAADAGELRYLTVYSAPAPPAFFMTYSAGQPRHLEKRPP